MAKKFAKEVEMSPPQASGLPTVKQIMDVYHKDHKKKKPAQGSEDEEESSEEEEEEEKKT